MRRLGGGLAVFAAAPAARRTPRGVRWLLVGISIKNFHNKLRGLGADKSIPYTLCASLVIIQHRPAKVWHFYLPTNFFSFLHPYLDRLWDNFQGGTPTLNFSSGAECWRTKFRLIDAKLDAAAAASPVARAKSSSDFKAGPPACVLLVIESICS